MWLLNTTSLQLKFIFDCEECTYAILSHTWNEDGEITFNEIDDLEVARKKPGFAKIEKTCELARKRNIKYAWVDTCCIDKSSSAELTESINSMFRWYKMSAVCFAFLSDLSSCGNNTTENILARCRWFTRGWTLQELIASKSIEFYDQDWNLKGNKVSWQSQLSKITNIGIEILQDSDLVSIVPVAKRMSWAATRLTKRLENRAYSLFGIFDVHLPLIYGEGSKAFIRLQEAIAVGNDLSLFAWQSEKSEQELRGILAQSPSEFESCKDLQRVNNPMVPRVEFTTTSKDFRITTRLSEDSEKEEGYFLSLQCLDGSMQGAIHQKLIAIRLLKTVHGYVRYKSDIPARISPSRVLPTEEVPIYISKVINPIESYLLRQRLKHRFVTTVRYTSGFQQQPYLESEFEIQPKHLFDSHTRSFITDGHLNFTGMITLRIYAKLRKRNSIWQHHESKYFVIFGLRAHGSTQENEINGKNKHLKTWAAIYKQDDGGSVSQILSEMKQQEIPEALADLGVLLSAKTSSGLMLPKNLKRNTYWRCGKSLVVHGEFIELHVSTHLHEDANSFGLYEVVLVVDYIKPP